MDTQELSARLPPPRDDEPPSLRQDILDELADHLHCSLRRELLATGNAEAARQKVIEKFGDPSAVARKLWLQAMWSKIMSQRLMLGAMGVLSAACLALAGLTIWFMQQQRVAAAQQQNALVEMVDRLVRLSESKGQSDGAGAVPATSVSSIQVKLTLGTPDGPPAKDHIVMLQHLGFDKETSTSESSNADGIADFGYFDAGRYMISVQTPWGYFHSGKRFVLHPSTAYVKRVVCPPKPQETQIAFVAALPEDLQRLGVQAIVHLYTGSFKHEDLVWRDTKNQSVQQILVRDGGWDALQVSIEQSMSSLAAKQPKPNCIIAARDARALPILAGASYPVRGLILVSPARNPPPPDAVELPKMATGPMRRFEVVAPRAWSDPEQRLGPRLFPHPLEVELLAEPGKLNEWVIPIPDVLIEQAREYLKDRPQASEKDE